MVCEPTGGYERRWVSGLRAGGLAVHLAHPNRVRDFTRAAGQAAQTDPLDAQARSRYGQVFEPSDPRRSRNGRNCGICGGVGSNWWNSACRS